MNAGRRGAGNAHRGRRVVFVGEYVMPDRTPAALRAMGLAQALRSEGYECEFGPAEVGESGGWLPRGTVRVFNGFQVTSMAELGGPSTSRARRAISFLVTFGRDLTRWLRQMDTGDLAAVVVLGGYTPMGSRLLSWSRATGVPLVVDVVEWYDPWHLLGGPLGPFRLQVEFALRVLYKRAAAIIAISSWLERYYASAGCRVLRVPPTVDADDPKWAAARKPLPHADSGLRVCYAGTPGKKDDVTMVVEGVQRARSTGADVRLTFVGPTAAEIAARLGWRRSVLDALGSSVRFLGRRPHTELPGLLAEADFTVLMRPDKRYANAGFPTKVVESLACGVPVIANATSDLAWAVRDGREGLIVEDYSADSLAASLARAAGLTMEERVAMRAGAEARAREVFDFRAYAAPLAGLVESLRA